MFRILPSAVGERLSVLLSFSLLLNKIGRASYSAVGAKLAGGRVRMVCLKRDSNPYWLTKLSLTPLKVCLIGYCFSNTQKTSARFPIGQVLIIHGVKQTTVSALHVDWTQRSRNCAPSPRLHTRAPWKSAIGPFGHQLCQERFLLAFAKSGAEGGAPGGRLRPTAVLARLAFSACA